MIKFFRHIRQNLLMENKTGKYFKYAIGEIVLVVIGILIALSLNNWNEDRKEYIIRNSYLTRLLNDHIRDNENLEGLIRDRKEYIERFETYIKYYETANYSGLRSLDSAFIIEKDLHRYLPVDITYQELINTGNIRLIIEELRISLAELASEKKVSVIINNSNVEDIKAQHREFKKYWDSPQSFYEKLNSSENENGVISGLRLRHNVLKTHYEWAKLMTTIYGGHMVRNKQIIDQIGLPLK